MITLIEYTGYYRMEENWKESGKYSSHVIEGWPGIFQWQCIRCTKFYWRRPHSNCFCNKHLKENYLGYTKLLTNK